jgi:hypothetical protein
MPNCPAFAHTAFTEPVRLALACSPGNATVASDRLAQKFSPPGDPLKGSGSLKGVTCDCQWDKWHSGMRSEERRQTPGAMFSRSFRPGSASPNALQSRLPPSPCWSWRKISSSNLTAPHLLTVIKQPIFLPVSEKTIGDKSAVDALQDFGTGGCESGVTTGGNT